MQDVNKDVIWTALELGWKHDISKELHYVSVVRGGIR